ncbi:MAG: oligosaccharide flippase family protein [Rubrivivax sp.]|nr:oligosaccharide flippase family protein [Rubrivivax sp.]
MKRGFGFHASNYAWAEIAATAAGLLSFPILTRLLSVADYGAMNLVAAVLGIAVALGKLGLQHAALRAWPEVQAGRSPYSPQVFRSTVFWGMAASGLVVSLTWLLLAWWIPGSWWAEPHIDGVMMLAAPLIGVRVIDSMLTNQLRAEEASLALAVYGTLRRYLALIVVVAVLWMVQQDLRGFYIATLVIEALVLLGLLWWKFRGREWPSMKQVSWPLYGSLALFGLPMLGSELSTVVLVMSDRFIIQSRLGAEALGIYAASYNMCDYMRNALLGAMVGAAYPRCLHLWETEGREGLQRFLNRFLRLYVLLAMYMVALMAVIGGELMAVLASAKYTAGGQVTGWIMAGLALQSVLTVAAIGIYLAKRTVLALALVLGSGLASIGANLILVPWLGIRGAGVAVCLVFLLLAAVQMSIAHRLAPVVVPWRALALGGAAALLAAGAAAQLHLGSVWLNLLAQGSLLSVLFGLVVLSLDASLRAELVQRLKAWRAA